MYQQYRNEHSLKFVTDRQTFDTYVVRMHHAVAGTCLVLWQKILLTECHLPLPAVSVVTASVTGVVLLAGGLIACGTTARANLMSTCLMWGTSTITGHSACRMYKKMGTPSKLLPQLDCIKTNQLNLKISVFGQWSDTENRSVLDHITVKSC
jgi:hypothetical protein